MITKIKIKYLRELNDRLHSNGFSWQHDDYFLLQEMLPEIIEQLEAQPKDSLD